MGKHRKLILFSTAVIILLAAAAAWLLTPRSCFPSGEEIKTTHVTAYDETGELLRLAEVSDLPALNTALKKLQRRECPSLMKAYALKDVAYELNGLCTDIPFCIVLQKDGTGFIYRPSSSRYTLCHPLVGTENWIILLDDLTAK